MFEHSQQLSPKYVLEFRYFPKQVYTLNPNFLTGNQTIHHDSKVGSYNSLFLDPNSNSESFALQCEIVFKFSLQQSPRPEWEHWKKRPN